MSRSHQLPHAKNISHSVLFRCTLRRGTLALAAASALAFAAIAQNSSQSSGQSTSTTGGTSTTAGQSKTVLAAPASPDAGKFAHVKAETGPPAEEINRKALEENAGEGAGKLFVRSTPTHARIYINGSFVGYAPQLFVVAPGKYKVELRGARDNAAERIVGLLPNATQEVSLDLTARYPSRVTNPAN